MDALKRVEKIIWENAFEQKTKNPRLKFNPESALIGLRTTGSRLQVLTAVMIGGSKMMNHALVPMYLCNFFSIYLEDFYGNVGQIFAYVQHSVYS